MGPDIFCANWFLFSVFKINFLFSRLSRLTVSILYMHVFIVISHAPCQNSILYNCGSRFAANQWIKYSRLEGWLTGFMPWHVTTAVWFTTTTTTVLRPFVQDYPGEPVPEETLTHPPSWSSSSLYQLLPSTTIHSILLVQITCLAVFLHNLSPCPLWFTSWFGALHLMSFFHQISHTIKRHWVA